MCIGNVFILYLVSFYKKENKIFIHLQAENRINQLEEEKFEAEEIARDKTEELSETIGKTICYWK